MKMKVMEMSLSMKGIDLEKQHCIACEGGSNPIGDEEIEILSKQILSWEIKNHRTALQRKFKFKSFLTTMSFINAVAYIANQEGHHPEVKFGYDYCIIELTTHSIKGLSKNDFICARKIDLLLP